MPRPSLRSTSLRKLQRSAPSGKKMVHYKRRRPEDAKCASCKKPLNGMPRLRPSGIGKLAKNKHRPNRAYGGNLCASCLKIKIKEKVLKLE